MAVILGRPDEASSRRYMRHYSLTREYDRQHADWEQHVTDRLEWSSMPSYVEAVRHDRQMFRTRWMDRDWLQRESDRGGLSWADYQEYTALREHLEDLES